jgi:hypothetical protein
VHNLRPVEGLRALTGLCLSLGIADADLELMLSRNAASLLGLDKGKPL